MALSRREVAALKQAAERFRRAGVGRRRARPQARRPGAVDAIAGAYEAALEPLAAKAAERLAARARELALPSLGARRDQLDATAADVRRELDRLAGALGERVAAQAAAAVEEAASRADAHSRGAVATQVRSALGVGLPDPADTSPLLSSWAEENSRRIRTLPAEAAGRAAALAARALAEGWTGSRLEGELEDMVGASRSDARRLARDQVGKLNARLTEARHRGLGITHFYWTTTGDERVRSEHVALSGRRFAYSEPPSEGLPGEPVQCRCTAEPDFATAGDDLPDGEGEEGGGPPDVAAELEIPAEPPRTRAQEILGPRLLVTQADDPAVRALAETLDAYPPRLWEALRDSGVEVYLGAGGIPNLDDLGHLRGERPRGWGEGQTWDQVAGIFDGTVVAAGTAEGFSFSGSVALHEVAHSVGFTQGFAGEDGEFVALHDDPELAAIHAELHDEGRLVPYLAQDGPGGEAGRQELFAEGFATYHARGRAAVVELWGGRFADWLGRASARFE